MKRGVNKMEIKVNTTELLNYRGNGDFFSALLKDKENNFYIVIGKTQGIDIIHEIEENFADYKIRFKTKEEFKLEIPLYPNKKGSTLTLIKLNNQEEYFTVTKILEMIL